MHTSIVAAAWFMWSLLLWGQTTFLFLLPLPPFPIAPLRPSLLSLPSNIFFNSLDKTLFQGVREGNRDYSSNTTYFAVIKLFASGFSSKFDFHLF